MNFHELFLIFSGLIAGTIDAIAGGGGLITLPVLTSVVGPGAHAIGTNKIVGTSGALIAFVVYFKNFIHRHPSSAERGAIFKKGFYFLIAIGAGSFLGSLCTPHLPKIYFRYLLIAVCPLVLWVLWNKQIFIQEFENHTAHRLWVLLATGVCVGFYDGFFGPGGGTFMLLGLLWAVRLPLFQALLLSKLANTISASVSLVSYGLQGYVHVIPGFLIACGMITGGYIGARLATKRAERVVRPVLAFVVILLLVMQIKELVS